MKRTRFYYKGFKVRFLYGLWIVEGLSWHPTLEEAKAHIDRLKGGKQ